MTEKATEMHFDIGPDRTACGAPVRVTGGTCAVPEHNCTRDLERVTCPDCLAATPRCPECGRYR